MSAEPKPMVTLTIDGKPVSVPKGTNMIEAAKSAGIEIPHYCYHPDLSIAGNCRMCQIQVAGQPKMTIACNTAAAEGMEIITHRSSKDVADAQAATLEFILINHPLDCTVCDQAGHCKLQDYHFEYNARPSRFLEEKEHKPKAVPLGPTVMLDAERCIMCTRCIRFCDEITKTSELGMLNRGDRTVIAISPGKELNNALSGSVVDLCPVGALTHRKWRFNTRIWFTDIKDAICPGCSTGCNVRVATRDGQVVQVKSRYNAQVNRDFLCDEGRYGFERFLPGRRITSLALVETEGEIEAASPETIAARIKRDGLRSLVVFVSPATLLEEFWLIDAFLRRVSPGAEVVIPYRERILDDVEKLLVSPDYACNFRGAELLKLVSGNLEAQYDRALDRLRRGELENVLLIGDRSIDPRDMSSDVLRGITKSKTSIGVLSDADSGLAASARIIFPGRTILEQAGLLINRAGRLQYTERVVGPIEGAQPLWKILPFIADAVSASMGGTPPIASDRDATQQLLKGNELLKGLSIFRIKQGGVMLDTAGKGSAGAESRTGA